MVHPALVPVAAVGVPDKIRGEVVKAFIVPRQGALVDGALRADVQGCVKSRLSAHEYPRQIEFRDNLPLAITGKIRREDLRDEAST
jgi:acetyl-CoA synthetase